MRHIQKPFHLTPGEAIHLERRAVNLLKSVVIPVRQGGQRHRVVRIKRQAGPDQAKALLHGVINQVQLRRNGLVGAGRNSVAAPVLPKTQAMIGTDNPVLIVKAERQRHAAVRAHVPGDHDLVVDPVNHQLFVQQGRFNRRRADVAGPGDRMPAFRQTQPVLWLKRAVGGWGRFSFHAYPSCVQPNGPP